MAKDMHKATFLIDRDVWSKIQNYAALRATTPSHLVREYFANLIEGKIPELYQEQLEERVEDIVLANIDHLLINRIAKKVYRMMDAAPSPSEMIETVSVSYTDDTDDTDDKNIPSLKLIRNNAPNNDLINDSQYQSYTDNTDNTDSKKSSGSVRSNSDRQPETKNISDRQPEEIEKERSPEEETTKNLSDRQLNFKSDRMFSDGEVAQAEGTSRQTIGRYRRGLRNPNDSTFWDRWAVHPTIKGSWMRRE